MCDVLRSLRARAERLDLTSTCTVHRSVIYGDHHTPPPPGRRPAGWEAMPLVMYRHTMIARLAPRASRSLFQCPGVISAAINLVSRISIKMNHAASFPIVPHFVLALLRAGPPLDELVLLFVVLLIVGPLSRGPVRLHPVREVD